MSKTYIFFVDDGYIIETTENTVVAIITKTPDGFGWYDGDGFHDEGYAFKKTAAMDVINGLRNGSITPLY